MSANVVVEQLGFSCAEVVSVIGRLSIADQFPKHKKRCGIYLLGFSNGTYYIGQAKDVVRRFAQHKKVYDNIENLWFQTIPERDLDTVEQRLIHQAEHSGLLLLNKVAIKGMNLRLMRKGGTIFSKFHCFELAKDVLK